LQFIKYQEEQSTYAQLAIESVYIVKLYEDENEHTLGWSEPMYRERKREIRKQAVKKESISSSK
jgi:hypothetical protein